MAMPPTPSPSSISEDDVRRFMEFKKHQEMVRAIDQTAANPVPAPAPAPEVRQQYTAPAPTPVPTPAPVAQRDPNAERYGVGVAINSRSSEDTEDVDWAHADSVYGRGLRHARIIRAATLASWRGGNTQEDVLRVLQDELKDRATARYLEAAYVREASSQKPVDGGILVPMITSDSIIEFLQPYTVMGQLGLTFVTIGAGNLSMPKETTGVSASYSFENAPIGTQAPPKFGATNWNTKRLGCEVPLPKELIRRASFDADAIFRRSMAKGMGQKMEYTFINGAGQNNEIVGLENHTELTDVTIGALIDGDNINKFKQKLRKNFVPTMGNVKWLFNEDHEYALQTVKVADEGYYFRKQMDEQQKLKGHPYLVSQNITTRGTSGAPSSIFYGDWSEYWVVREGAMEIQASDIAPYETADGVKSAFSRHQVVTKMVDFHDMAPRDGRAICRCKDAKTTV